MRATDAGLVPVFLYGTLLDPAILAARAGRRGLRGVPATLPGWGRVALRGQPYPTLIRARRQAVRGRLVTLAGAPLRRLHAYEGACYRLRPVLVLAPRGRLRALAWIARPALANAARPWQTFPSS
ncbi:gamma-glutamylcyclotransferase family protein [Falsiroseomonas ponticola]|uniref:gamma-glutamylcyclotransferase family protein n=1 Tax=Falsiroseomonas ponticola TaxID=2786951 RepID=UPI0019334A20|nr:gamma-glutamylcyclotransferase family protein [Roseomonas ponticola]